jgi:putative ABC transport system permease protein
MTGSLALAVEDVVSAARTLWANRMRSFLTTAGIVIGVTTVTGVASLVQGLDRQVLDALGGMGARTLYIQKMPAVAMGGGREFRRRADFSLDDVRELASIPGVAAAVPSAQWYTMIKAPDGVSLAVMLEGTSADWPVVSHRDMMHGRFMTSWEVQSRSRVCVIGASVSERLFGDADPTGMEIEAQGRRLVVTGVLESFGEILGENQDDIVLIPYTVFPDFASFPRNMSIAVEIAPGEDVDRMISTVESCMRRRRGLSLDDGNDFELVTADQLLDTYRDISGGIFVAMLAISAIALVVGSVGIANIMLVSVTERTREIGLRKALGATDGQILGQFLTESVLLSLVGGAIGIVFGSLLAMLVSAVTPVPAGLEAWSVVAGVLASALVGMAAGAFPAARAARLEPVRALGYSQ